MSVFSSRRYWLSFGVLSLCLFSYASTQAELRGQVNRRTLNFFLPVDMLALPCFMPIEIRGAYNSYSGDSSIFGQKWTFNHNIRVVPERSRLKVMEGDGFENYYTREKNLEEAKKTLTDQILIAQKKIDSKAGGLKSAAAYDELKRKLLSDTSFREEQESKLLTPRPLGPGTYYSFSRGPSTVELKPDGTFVRTFQNKSAEYFNKDGQLIKSVDKYGNALNYSYSGRNLTRINDGCGGFVNFSYKTDKAMEGLVDTMRDSLNRELKFEFLPNRRLKAFQNLAKEMNAFTYDSIGNMLSLSITPPVPPGGKPAPQTTQLAYNAQYEVQKQIDPSGRETRYSRTFVANNQNHSITEIAEYQGDKLASRELQEVKLREYESSTKFDGKGAQVSKETKKLSPTTGYPVSVLDDRGSGELIDYDSNSGNPIRREIVPSGDIMEYEYDPNCNQVTKVRMKRPGKTTSEASFKYDSFCNPLRAEETQNGKKVVAISLKWTHQGKIAFLIDELGKREIGFTYWKFGKTESITLRDVGTLLVKYTPPGDIEKVDTFPHGKGKERFASMKSYQANGVILSEVKSALDSILGSLKPSGINIGL